MSRLTVLEIAALLHCRNLAMLQAYFDESGTHGDAKVTCIAGYVGTTDEWIHVENQWQEILAPHASDGLHWWHMSEFPYRGQFERIGKEKGELILGQLANLIQESELQVIWAGVDADVFAAANPDLGSNGMKPYDFCFFWIIRQLTVWAAQKGYADRIGMMFAIQDEYNDRSELALKSWHAAGVLQQLGPIAFDYPKYVPALQPADMLVNQLYGAWTKYAKGNGTSPIILSPLLRSITRSGLKEGGFATDQTVAHYARDPDWVSPGLLGISE